MRFIGNLLRTYSYIFESILCVLAIAIAILIFANPAQTVNLGWLPWSGDSLPSWLLGLGLLGLLSVILAFTGRLRLLHFLFAIAALVILVRGLFLGSWTFHGAEEAKRALWLVLAAFVAAIGAIPLSTGRPQRNSRA